MTVGIADDAALLWTHVGIVASRPVWAGEVIEVQL